MTRRNAEQIAASLELKARQLRDEAARKEAVGRSEVARLADDAARAVRRLMRTYVPGNETRANLYSIAEGLDEIRRSEHRARCDELDSKGAA